MYSKRRTAFFWGWFVPGKNNMEEDAESAAAAFGYIGDRDDEHRLIRKEDFQIWEQMFLCFAEDYDIITA